MVDQEHSIDPTDDNDFEKRCFVPRTKETKHILELTENQLTLIGRALDIYSRLGMGQFDTAIHIHSTIQNHVFKMNDISRKKFDLLLLELGFMLHKIPGNGSWGILNKETGDDSKLAAHIYQTIRHHLWLEDKDPNKPNHTVDAYPADIWNMSKNEELIIPIKKLDDEGTKK